MDLECACSKVEHYTEVNGGMINLMEMESYTLAKTKSLKDDLIEDKCPTEE